MTKIIEVAPDKNGKIIINLYGQTYEIKIKKETKLIREKEGSNDKS
jgi:hypothetical protein